jgi:hypothetical protein
VRYAIDSAGSVTILDREPRPIGYERELLTAGRVWVGPAGKLWFGTTPDHDTLVGETRREVVLALIYRTAYARGY